MATTEKIRTLGPGSFKIKTGSGSSSTDKDLSADLIKAQLVPSNSTDDPTTFLDGSELTSTTTNWTFEGTVMDDFTAGGLAEWLFDHAGETLDAVFIPANKATSEWDLKVTITPIGIGGDVKAKNTQDLSFPVTNLTHKTRTAS